MKISKHRPLLLYLCVVAFSAFALILTGIAFAIPFSVPVAIAIASAIFGYYLSTKKPKENEIKIEKKIEEKEITVPKPLTPYFAHPYLMHKNFTGRKKEREELTEWLKGDCNPVFVYVAMGGMGKSALAWHWLTEDILGSGEPPRKIVWWSFYDRESSFGRFLRKAIEYFSDDEVDWSSLESKRDQMEHLHKILRDNRFLLVLDGVERMLRAYYSLESPYQSDEIEEVGAVESDFRSCIDPNFGMFLQWLASGNLRTKTLLTSRLYPKELDEVKGSWGTDLKEMGRGDAVLFFRSRGVVGTRAEIEAACGVVGYHPLSLRLLSGLIVHDPRNPGDIQEWGKYNVIPDLKGREGHNILDLAYDSLDEEKQMLISRLSAFRNPMDYDATTIFNDFGNEGKFNEALIELVDRGLLFRNVERNRFDLHPVVRRYCYGRLSDKEAVHVKLIEYFAKIPEPEEIRTVDDLAPVIELYHHTARAGRYDGAMYLFSNRLSEPLHYRFGVYQPRIELLRALFPDGEDKLPRLKEEIDQAWTLNALANSYLLSGQVRRAIPLFEMSNEIDDKRGAKRNVAVGLGNLATGQMRIGELDTAESNLRRKIEICREIKYRYSEAIGHEQLATLMALKGKYKQSENEDKIAMKMQKNLKNIQGQCQVWFSNSMRSLLMSSAGEALKSAIKARELADVKHHEVDIIRAEYLIGAAHLMKKNFIEVKKHLTEALIRDRKINFVEFEPDILLEFAKLGFKHNYKKEALEFADEALQIADRCEYRLKQADIHNFLAEFYLDSGDRKKARLHGTIAKERAECGYKPALGMAEELLAAIGEE